MRRSTQSVRQKLQARAGREVAQSNNDVLAFADRNREIIQLPEGLETGETMRRERGARTDDDVIQEVIEIFAQGITITASLRYVGLPYATWHKWRKENTVMQKSFTRSLTFVTSKRSRTKRCACLSCWKLNAKKRRRN